MGKIVMANELDRKKTSHGKKSKTHHQHQQQHQYQEEHQQMQLLTTAEQLQMELEHMQKHDSSKSMKGEQRTEDKRCGLSLIDGNRVQPNIPTAPFATKSRTLHSNSAPSYYQQKIPRFERSRVGTICSNNGSLP